MVDAPPGMTMMRLGIMLVFVVTFAFALGVVLAAVVLQMLAS